MLWMPEPKCTPACASSSSTTAAWAKLPSPPPYASGRSGSSRPVLPACVQASASGRCCSRQRACCGANSFWMNWRTVARNIRSSSFIHGESFPDAAIYRSSSISRSVTTAATKPGTGANASRRRGQRYVEAIERMEQAVAQRLDERFLASPALEESQRPLARLERPVRGVFARRKPPGGDVVRIGERAHRLHVDAHFPPRGEGVHGHIFTVRHVEPQIGGREPSGQRGFAARPGGKLDRFGLLTEPRCEQLPQQRPRDDESVTIRVEREAARPLSLAVRQQRRRGGHRVGPDVRARHDYFNVAVGERRRPLSGVSCHCDHLLPASPLDQSSPARPASRFAPLPERNALPGPEP